MQQRTVAGMLRVKEGQGNQPYYPAIVAANGTIKPFYARIGGKPVFRPDGVWSKPSSARGEEEHLSHFRIRRFNQR